MGEVFEENMNASEAAISERDRLAQTIDRLSRDLEIACKRCDFLEKKLHSVSDPLDAGYFRLDLRKYNKINNEPDEFEALAGDWEQKFDDGKYGGLLKTIFQNTSIRIAVTGSEDYFRPFAAYYLCDYFVWRGNHAKAAYYEQFINFSAPARGTDLLPYDLRQASRLVRSRQQRAIENSRPSIPVVSLMKSASAYLTNAISNIMQVPTIRISVGHPFGPMIVKRWVDQLALGGAVTHEHFHATEINLQILSDCTIRDIWVQLRDPRDAAYSFLKMEEFRSQHAHFESHKIFSFGDSVESGFIQACQFFAKWISDWLAASDSISDLDIHFLNFEDVTGDLRGTVKSILGDRFDSAIESATRAHLDKLQTGEAESPNFRTGRGEEWRQAFPKAVHEKVWQYIPDPVREFLDLRP